MVNTLEVILNVSHITRHDTEQNWMNKNPILLKGEQGFVTTEYIDGLIGLAETNLAKIVSIETEFTPDPYVPLAPEVGSDDYATQQWVIDKGYATIVYVNGLIGTSLETLSNLVV